MRCEDLSICTTTSARACVVKRADMINAAAMTSRPPDNKFMRSALPTEHPDLRARPFQPVCRFHRQLVKGARRRGGGKLNPRAVGNPAGAAKLRHAHGFSRSANSA